MGTSAPRALEHWDSEQDSRPLGTVTDPGLATRNLKPQAFPKPELLQKFNNADQILAAAAKSGGKKQKELTEEQKQEIKEVR